MVAAAIDMAPTESNRKNTQNRQQPYMSLSILENASSSFLDLGECSLSDRNTVEEDREVSVDYSERVQVKKTQLES